MSFQTRAAQYIRMSTDRQDLSPLVQRDAIAAYARTKGIELVQSYEDEGRSGLQLTNRPALRKLLKDVANRPPFTEILVYDVSRWGRFQDADASAYYEYHCRLHGVQVIYVSESFANDQTPTTVLLKSMRRVMAAEYSRDIAFKARAGQQRAVSMGFHMGPLPALGYRRCSVSADGSRRVELKHGQRKLALTDRIEWVPGPEPEVDLVRRMCAAYSSGFALEEIVGLADAEGWRTDKGRQLSTQGLRRLLTNEALIGNFVWGVKSKGGKVIKSEPTRMNGSTPKIIDDALWESMQIRFRIASQAQSDQPKKSATYSGVQTVGRTPKQLSLPLERTTTNRGYRETLGTPQQLREHTKELGRALCSQLLSRGLPTAFDPRTNILTFWRSRVRVRLMWPSDEATWILDSRPTRHSAQTLLIARMRGLYCPMDFFIVPSESMPGAFSRPIPRDVPRALRRFWCSPGETMIERLSITCAG
jgi:DNA invertase Pin-like site-specific DNA recombinase